MNMLSYWIPFRHIFLLLVACFLYAPFVWGQEDLAENGIGIAIRDQWNGVHLDLRQRIHRISAQQIGNHGTQVAGIIAGAGNINPDIRGIVPTAHLYLLTESPSSSAELIELHLSKGVQIVYNPWSEGCNSGYTSSAKETDDLSNRYPQLLHIFSAGNKGRLDCGYGAGPGWGNISGGAKAAKTALTVGSVDRSGKKLPSSSVGPTKDGRIKPEVCALGQDVWTTHISSTYKQVSGSSFAGARVVGEAAFLYQNYQSLWGTVPSSSLIKLILLNSADDLGNEGPDYAYGFGRTNIFRAQAMIRAGILWQDTLHAQDTQTFSIQVPESTKELRIMLYWPDALADSAAARILVNDLSLSLWPVDEGNVYHPLVLSIFPQVDSLMHSARPGQDSINNVEQIVLKEPIAGEYFAQVSSNRMGTSSQAFSLGMLLIEPNELHLSSPQANQALSQGGETKIQWSTLSQDKPFQLHFSPDGKKTWQLQHPSIPGHVREIIWKVPDYSTDQGYLRLIQDEAEVSIGPLTIFPTPHTLAVDAICSHMTTLSWEAVPTAMHYDIFKLSGAYMDSVTTVSSTTDPNRMVTTLHQNEFNIDTATWWAVRAKGLPGSWGGPRSQAQLKPAGTWNCGVVDIPMIRTDNILKIRAQRTHSQALFISFQPKYDTPLHCVIFNPLGQEVYQRTIELTSMVPEIVIPPLPAGVYTVQILQKGVYATKKWILR